MDFRFSEIAAQSVDLWNNLKYKNDHLNYLILKQKKKSVINHFAGIVSVYLYPSKKKCC